MTGIFKRHDLFDPQALPEPPAISELFHVNTMLHPDAIGAWKLPGDYSGAEESAMSAPGHVHEDRPSVVLPEVLRTPQPFDEIIGRRRTRRDFSAQPLPLAALSTVLFHTFGVTGEIVTKAGVPWKRRAAPSAGALYPLEIYLGVRHVEGLGAGLYHYHSDSHTLRHLDGGDPTERLVSICCDQPQAGQSAAAVFFTLSFDKVRRKYGERGYRYALLDAGHAAQNLCLSCCAQDLAAMTTCGFFDNRANGWLGLDGVDEGAVYVAFIGVGDDPDAGA